MFRRIVAFRPNANLTLRRFSVSRLNLNPFPGDEFTVSSDRGFLPRQDPPTHLPQEYAHLESLLQRMPTTTLTGEQGLLAQGKLGDAVHQELPEYNLEGVTDFRLLSTLYRDLTFLASAYLLEPCDIAFQKTGDYGLGRPILPKNIAKPLMTAATKIGAKPFMEYALSYSLYNYQRVDLSKGYDFDNLRLIRAFTNSKDEAGFILVHVAMVQHSGRLVDAVLRVLEECSNAPRMYEIDEVGLKYAVSNLERVLGDINAVMETMWSHSDPKRYLSFRTFIMGSKSQPMFPKGTFLFS